MNEKIPKTYDMKKYQRTYFDKKKSIITICTVCNGRYNVFNKYNHHHTAKHQQVLKFNLLKQENSELIAKIDALQKAQELMLNNVIINNSD